MRRWWPRITRATALSALLLFGLYLVSGYGLAGKTGFPGSLGLRYAALLHTSTVLRILSVIAFLAHGASGVEMLLVRLRVGRGHRLLLRLALHGPLAYVAWVAAWGELGT